MLDDIPVVLLASGLSRRMGRDKMMIDILGRPLILYTLEKYRKVFREIIIVISPNTDLVSLVAKEVSKLAINSRPEEGISRSIRIGLSCLPASTQGFILALGDQPLVSLKTFRKIVRAFLESKADAVVPLYKGIRGNPVIFRHSMKEKLLSSLKGDRGARDIIDKNSERTVFIETNDPGVRVDVDTPADVEKLVSLIKKRAL
jgi:molybdenum cofactor cytidylyltransferase